MPKVIHSIVRMLIGAAWVAGAVFLEEVRGWNGVGCVILSLPGLICFAAGVCNE